MDPREQATPPRFKAMDRVRMRADRQRAGIVMGVLPAGESWAYSVYFSDLDRVQVNESALEAVAPDRELHIVSRDAFLRALLLTKLENPVTDLLYAYQASRTQFEAYQFKPVLKFLESPVPAILIADEVGLGKTIEAAILYQELKERGSITRVLVVCPSGLRQKWQAELLTRFDEQFTLMRRPEIEEDVRLYRETNGARPLHGIVSLETIRGREVQDSFEGSGVTYDLVIIDEAHHLRNSGTLSNEVGERLREMTENLVLLTATPLQTRQEDLFNLLQFVDPTQFSDYEDFLLQLEPNAFINDAIKALREIPPDGRAALERLEGLRRLPAGGQVFANPRYDGIIRALRDGPLDRERLVATQRDIDSLNVLSSIYTRTKKSDVSEVARRSAHAIQVRVTDQERQFIEAVLAHARAEARANAASGMMPAFAGMMRERQAASCIAAMREYLADLLSRRDVDIGLEDSSPDLDPASDQPGPLGETAALRQLHAAAEALGSTDSKLDHFLTALHDAIAESRGSKVIVFSFFRRTLAYLHRELVRRGYRVIEINGSVPPESRTGLIESFKVDPSIQIMLTSEVGAEGLDFQFCDTLFNYDLPWNPMKVEQRIGRIDRYGQRSPQVRIYSLFLSDTVEERILQRLYDRIGLFEESIGDLEPILGPIASELTREVFRTDLTPEQEKVVAEKYARMVVHRRETERELEQSRSKLLGQDALLMQSISESIDSGRYVSSAELRSVVSGYLQAKAPGAELVDRLGDGSVMLRPDGLLRSLMHNWLTRTSDYRPVATAFLAKLGRSTPIPGTFDGTMAYERRLLEFFNLRHPLVQLAVDHYRGDAAGRRHPSVSLSVDVGAFDEGNGIDVGEAFDFVLFLLAVSGALRQVRIVAVVFDQSGRRAPKVEERLLRLIQDHAIDDSPPSLTIEDWEALETRARQSVSAIADQIEADARERNDGAIAVRRATLQRTFGHRIARRRAQLAAASDERIVRMRRAEVENLTIDVDRRLGELERGREVGVTVSIIGSGRLAVSQRDAYVAHEPQPTAAVREDEVIQTAELYPEPPTVFEP